MQKKSLETILYSSAGIVVMLVILIAVNVITGAKPLRVDLTQDKAYTLSAGTKAILTKLDTPVKIRFYCSQSDTATPETVYLKDYARKVQDLLQEYQEIAGKNLIIQKFDPEPDSDAEDSARLDGLQPQQLPGVDPFYLGLSVSMADQRVAIPFLAPNREKLLEYDITRANWHHEFAARVRFAGQSDDDANGAGRRHSAVDVRAGIATGFQRQTH
jgi:ABC-type uncharacterized transport system involved in gliding motility auxiliary subunit